MYCLTVMHIFVRQINIYVLRRYKAFRLFGKLLCMYCFPIIYLDANVN